jgi:hypothetical protein
MNGLNVSYIREMAYVSNAIRFFVEMRCLNNLLVLDHWPVVDPGALQIFQ